MTGENPQADEPGPAGAEGAEAAEGADSAEPSGPAESGDDPEAQEQSDLQITQQVHNIFHGQVFIGDHGTAGFSVGENVRRDTGRVAEADVEALRRTYFRPSAHADARRLLLRENLLILVGPEGSGRAAAALVLADEARRAGTPQPWINRLPPTRTLAELAKQKFKPGQAYVLQDWIQAGPSRAALAHFDAAHLAQHLAGSGAYLIITTAYRSRPGEGTFGYEVAWTAPDPVGLFDHCLGRQDYGSDIAGDQLPALRERARQVASARRVVHLVGRLRHGTEAALAEDDDRAREEIRAWFDDKPDRRALRAVAILVLACRAGDEPPDRPGVTQHGFEHLFAALGAAEARYRGDQVPEAVAPPDDEVFPQVRRSLFEEAGLTGFTVGPPVATAVGLEHSPGFRTVRQRALFQAELHLRCGHELWSPIRLWLSDLVQARVVTDVHLAIACGIGRMALFETRRVREDYLDEWAAGLTTTRFCAVFALWAMAAEEQLAPIALTQARGWIRGRGQERAIAAAIALGGPLGKRYPSEAMWYLWDLARRGQRISVYARVSISNLLGIEAAADEPNSAGFLAGKARAVLVRGTPAELRRPVLALLADILAVPGSDPDVPGVADVLRQSPRAAGPIGELWAAVLCSGPHRAAGIATLHLAIDALAQSPDGVAVATRLGGQILPRLSPAHRRQLEVGLRTSRSPEIRIRMRDALAAFLGAARPRPDGSALTEPGEE
ncbi:MAG TPA: hypothetical protein VGX23_04485 [Actinocrinis sp.]|nr:hypothetical protein [Actinocrinis sp.]